MEQNKSYLMVGSFVLAGFLGILVFAVWLNDASGKHDYHYYQIRFHESVNGLSDGSPVKYRGVDIGNVVSIKIDLAETNTIITRVRISEGAPVKQDTVAMLKIQGITGASYIELSGGEASQQEIIGSKVDKGDLPEIPSKFSDMATLSNEVPELISKSSTIATQAGHLLDDESVAHVHAILKRWDTISTILEQETTHLDVLMKSTDHLVRTTDKVMSQIDAANVGGTLKNLHETSVQLNNLAVDTHEAATTSFENFDALMLDAKKTSQDLRALTRNLNENPSQILFPSSQKQEHLP
jgi:phospholipid/cholesterol/gamma-HCH transport system substrate-binding protein